MASRPIFLPCDSQYQLVREMSVDFLWHAGLAPTQKRKNVVALHEAGKSKGIWPLLEISTKSEVALGFRLSAFNLKVEMDDGWTIPLESAFQGSKVFQHGGPYINLYGKSGFDIKKDDRLHTSGPLTGFTFQNMNWELEPKTAFYDWLYLHAVNRDPELRDELTSYNGFTDIEFNPERSINCQARSCALYVSLHRRGVLDAVIKNRDQFMDILNRDSFYQPHSAEKRQGTLFHMDQTTIGRTRRSTTTRRKRREGER